MKKFHVIMHFFDCLIKKIFCICQKNDIYHDCEEALSLLENQHMNPGENEVEEYLANYQSTTRWQTL